MVKSAMRLCGVMCNVVVVIEQTANSYCVIVCEKEATSLARFLGPSDICIVAVLERVKTQAQNFFLLSKILRCNGSIVGSFNEYSEQRVSLRLCGLRICV